MKIFLSNLHLFESLEIIDTRYICNSNEALYIDGDRECRVNAC